MQIYHDMLPKTPVGRMVGFDDSIGTPPAKTPSTKNKIVGRKALTPHNNNNNNNNVSPMQSLRRQLKGSTPATSKLGRSSIRSSASTNAGNRSADMSWTGKNRLKPSNSTKQRNALSKSAKTLGLSATHRGKENTIAPNTRTPYRSPVHDSTSSTVANAPAASVAVLGEKTPNSAVNLRRNLRATISPTFQSTGSINTAISRKRNNDDDTKSKNSSGSSGKASSFTPLQFTSTQRGYTWSPFSSAPPSTKSHTIPEDTATKSKSNTNTTSSSGNVNATKPTMASAASSINKARSFTSQPTLSKISIVLPKTPNSLLRTELGDDDPSNPDVSLLEESLLVSPTGAVWQPSTTSPTAAKARRNNANARDSPGTESPTVDIDKASLLILSPQAAQQVHEVQKHLQNQHKHEPNSVNPSSATSATNKGRHTSTVSHATPLSSITPLKPRVLHTSTDTPNQSLALRTITESVSTSAVASARTATVQKPRGAASTAISTPATTRKGVAFTVSVDRPSTTTSKPRMQRSTPKSKPQRQPQRQLQSSQSTSKYGKLGRTHAPSKVTSVQKSPKRREASWADKQSTTFTSWLNYTLNPIEGAEESSEPQSGGRNTGLRTLFIHQHLAQCRSRAAEIFQSDEMERVKTIVDQEIKKGRLAIRTDRDIHADLMLRRSIINLLSSYSQPWLRIALEVVFGEILEPVSTIGEPQQSTATRMARPSKSKKQAPTSATAAAITAFQRMRQTIKAFLAERVLSDSTVLAHYTRGKCKVPSGKFEKLYKAEMRSIVLRRLIVLVIFLDMAKMENVLDKVPRLFIKTSKVKSSKDVLQSLCRECLTGEGDFLKHLNRLGLKVHYRQQPVDEVNLHVDNLATDLRDGSCLTRLAEIVAGCKPKQFMTALRLPAGSRLQKLHNVGIALKNLRSFGISIPQDVIPHQIVDGHREMVLKLMWSIIAQCCMEKLLREDCVEEEIRRVHSSNRVRFKIEGRSLHHLAAQQEMLRNFIPLDASPEETMKRLLLRWCQVVCACYGIGVTDFSQSFADGTVFCLLIHYYHPSSLRRHEIKPTTRSPAFEEGAISQDLASSNERVNCRLASSRATDLGGIPCMLPTSDTNSPPNEQSILLCLSYLCSRLMESSREVLSCILIQKSYRKHFQKIMLERKKAAASTIFQYWQANKGRYLCNQRLKYHRQVAIIENFVWTHRRSLVQMKHSRLINEYRTMAAIQIQRMFRGMLGRWEASDAREERDAAVIIQSIWRGRVARRVADQRFIQVDSATAIQSVWRRYIAWARFQYSRQCIIQAQRMARGSLARKKVIQQQQAATIIQEAWLAYLNKVLDDESAILIQAAFRRWRRRKLERLAVLEYDAATLIQATFRGWQDNLSFQMKIECAKAIQRIWRGHRAQQDFEFMRWTNAAIKIQAAWRGFSGLVAAHLKRFDAITIQSAARQYLARRIASERRAAVSTLQCAFRSALARNQLNQLHHQQLTNLAAVRIQASFRAFLASKTFTETLHAATVLQSSIRRFRARADFLRDIASVVMIQRRWRYYSYEKSRSHAAATLIQAAFRRFFQSKSFRNHRAAATTIQAAWRCIKYRRMLESAVFAATTIQAAWRRCATASKFKADVLATTTCQGVFRGWKARREASTRRQAVLMIQSHVRLHLARSLVTRKRHAYNLAVASIQQAWRHHRHVARCTAAATMLQNAYRRHHAHQTFLRRNVASITIQAIWRGRMIRCVLRMKEAAAIDVQKIWRCHRASRKYLVVKWRIILYQSSYRRWKQRNECQRRLDMVVRLQCFARLLVSRVALQDLKQKKAKRDGLTKASVRIQAVWRRYHASKSFHKSIKDVIVVQSIARLRFSRQQAQTRRVAVLKLQAFAWGVVHQQRIQDMLMCGNQLAMLEHDAAVTIQSAWRSRKAAEAYGQSVTRVIRMQSFARSYIARCHAVQKSNAIACIQRAARSWRAHRELTILKMQRDIFMIEYSAAVTIQSFIRGHQVREELIEMDIAASIIQARFRGFLIHNCFRMLTEDVIMAQCVVRSWLARRRVGAMHDAATAIQSIVRTRIARSELYHRQQQRWEDNTRETSSTNIQRVWRGRKARQIARRHAGARAIQKTWRCYVAHVDYIMSVIGIIKFQSHVRAHIVRARLQRAQDGITKLQALVRGALWRNEMRFRANACTAIQSLGRGYVIRNRLLMKRQAATCIQRHARGFQIRLSTAYYNLAAREIQRVWRGYKCETEYMMNILATMKIQAAVRRIQAKSRVQALRLQTLADELFLHHKATIIQRQFREYQFEMRKHDAAYIIQRAVSTFLYRKITCRVARGIKRVQAIARARRVRQHCSRKCVHIVHRIDKANRKAQAHPQLKIGVRTQEALFDLKYKNRLSDIMAAVMTLETTTRLSYPCCQSFVTTNTTSILLEVIRKCNRSLPHLELVHCILRTLLTVASHDDLLPHMATLDCGEVLLDLIQTFRDKDSIFSISIDLLDPMLRCSPDIAALCASRENNKRMKSVYNMSMRKFRASVSDHVGSDRRSSARLKSKHNGKSKGVAHEVDMGQYLKKTCAMIKYVDKTIVLQRSGSHDEYRPSSRRSPRIASVQKENREPNSTTRRSTSRPRHFHF